MNTLFGGMLSLALPQSFAGAATLLAIILIVTYILLRAFIRVEPVRDVEVALDDDEDDNEGDSAEPPSAPKAWEPPKPEPPDEPMTVESVRVGEAPIAVGDTSSQVMRAFRASESAMTPLVDRNADGRATHVTRAYVAGRRRLTLTFEREDSADPLRLTRIEIGDSARR
ncbi:MAG TPA: hypothetical protein VGM37_09305 [Armatimonadota bacterium]